jgi:hypothetical protein
MLLSGCVTFPRREAPVVPPLEVRAPSHLRLAVAGMVRRPLEPATLTPPERAGVRWDYEVLITDTGGIGVRLEMLRMTVRSLAGTSVAGVQSLPSRVEPHGTTPITLQASLSSSIPDAPGELVGVHELTFLGTDDRGQPVRIVARVPLE